MSALDTHDSNDLDTINKKVLEARFNTLKIEMKMLSSDIGDACNDHTSMRDPSLEKDFIECVSQQIKDKYIEMASIAQSIEDINDTVEDVEDVEDVEGKVSEIIG